MTRGNPHSWQPTDDKQRHICRKCGMSRFKDFAYGRHYTVWTDKAGHEYVSLFDLMPSCPIGADKKAHI